SFNSLRICTILLSDTPIDSAICDNINPGPINPDGPLDLITLIKYYKAPLMNVGSKVNQRITISCVIEAGIKFSLFLEIGGSSTMIPMGAGSNTGAAGSS
ncbi:hypothetical protein L9F63_021426, partial [Diploptera punctata]